VISVHFGPGAESIEKLRRILHKKRIHPARDAWRIWATTLDFSQCELRVFAQLLSGSAGGRLRFAPVPWEQFV
jgi:hypothetical protein